MSKKNETKPLKQRAVRRNYLEEVFPNLVLGLVANVSKVIVVLNHQTKRNLLKTKCLFGVIVNMP